MSFTSCMAPALAHRPMVSPFFKAFGFNLLGNEGIEGFDVKDSIEGATSSAPTKGIKLLLESFFIFKVNHLGLSNNKLFR